MKDFKVQTILRVSEELVKDAFCSGLEGGINYWAKVVNHNREYIGCDYLYEIPFQEGGFIEFVCIDEEELNFNIDEIYRIDRKKLEKGLQIMSDKFMRHFNDIITENVDATTGDVLIQCALFGDSFIK